MPARLIALTDEARRAIEGEYLTIDRLPFRVGRECRSTLAKVTDSLERRLGSVPQLNDLYIVESPLGQFFHVSREHLLIDQEQGQYFLSDRGSVCGTIVAGQVLGGDRRGGRLPLHDNDVIVIGTSASPFSFRFRSA